MPPQEVAEPLLQGEAKGPVGSRENLQDIIQKLRQGLFRRRGIIAVVVSFLIQKFVGQDERLLQAGAVKVVDIFAAVGPLQIGPSDAEGNLLIQPLLLPGAQPGMIQERLHGPGLPAVQRRDGYAVLGKADLNFTIIENHRKPPVAGEGPSSIIQPRERENNFFLTERIFINSSYPTLIKLVILNL